MGLSPLPTLHLGAPPTYTLANSTSSRQCRALMIDGAPPEYVWGDMYVYADGACRKRPASKMGSSTVGYEGRKDWCSGPSYLKTRSRLPLSHHHLIPAINPYEKRQHASCSTQLSYRTHH